MKNLFMSILTNTAPASNYRGESENNRSVLQKLTIGDEEHLVISSESMRNALREILSSSLPTNRSRVHDDTQLAVRFKGPNDENTYADDFIFGFMRVEGSSEEALSEEEIAAAAAEAAATEASGKKSKGKGKGPATTKKVAGEKAKRVSPLRMNMAVSTSPYRQDQTFHQSPKVQAEGGFKEKGSVLYHKEAAVTAFQYPVALHFPDFEGKAAWGTALLDAIGELTGVAGGHARNFYEMAPRSIVARVTKSRVAGYETYGFNEEGGFNDLTRINAGDLSGKEFVVAGELARKMPVEEKERLVAEGVRFFDNPQQALKFLSENF